MATDRWKTCVAMRGHPHRVHYEHSLMCRVIINSGAYYLHLYYKHYTNIIRVDPSLRYASVCQDSNQQPSMLVRWMEDGRSTLQRPGAR